MQGYLNDTSLAITNNGTRSSKLSLIESRLQNQKTTFETLQSQNEDIDITEVAIGLESASVTYEAALMATSKIMQNTLLNYL
jgi:flagellar hook-associated protein 3 FlgL